MSEKLKHFEREHSPEEMEQLTSKVEEYLLDRSEPLVEVTDRDIDSVLSRYIEKGAELSPDVKVSLRKAIKKIFGVKLQKR